MTNLAIFASLFISASAALISASATNAAPLAGPIALRTTAAGEFEQVQYRYQNGYRYPLATPIAPTATIPTPVTVTGAEAASAVTTPRPAPIRAGWCATGATASKALMRRTGSTEE